MRRLLLYSTLVSFLQLRSKMLSSRLDDNGAMQRSRTFSTGRRRDWVIKVRGQLSTDPSVDEAARGAATQLAPN